MSPRSWKGWNVCLNLMSLHTLHVHCDVYKCRWHCKTNEPCCILQQLSGTVTEWQDLQYTHTTHGTLVVTKTQFHTVVKAHCTNGVWNTILFHFLSDNNKHVSLCMGVVCSASSQCTQIMNMQAYHWNESANKTKDTSSKCNATIVVMTFL